MLFHHGGLNSYEQEKDHQTLSFQGKTRLQGYLLV